MKSGRKSKESTKGNFCSQSFKSVPISGSCMELRVYLKYLGRGRGRKEIKLQKSIMVWSYVS